MVILLQLMAASGIHFTQAFEGMFIDVVRIPVPVSEEEESYKLREQIK
jgi:adenosylmethionine-8-amino-7-oxononanoate aminotransferase